MLVADWGIWEHRCNLDINMTARKAIWACWAWIVDTHGSEAAEEHLTNLADQLFVWRFWQKDIKIGSSKDLQAVKLAAIRRRALAGEVWRPNG